MNNITTITASITKAGNRYELIPVSYTDRKNLDLIIDDSDHKYLSVTVRKSRSSKTYQQIKTAWALIDILFQSMYFRRPTEAERKQLYQELLSEYSERRESLLHKGQTVAVSFSEMTSRQMSVFIQNLINLLSDCCDLQQDEQSDVKILFEEWQMYMSSLEDDPRDYDENGNMLSLDEWRAKNSVSFASGLGGDLDLAHIVSRGADEIHKDCCWNTMMLTHEEHMMQHKIGWVEFLKIYPHLAGRVARARRIAHKLELMEA